MSDWQWLVLRKKNIEDHLVGAGSTGVESNAVPTPKLKHQANGDHALTGTGKWRNNGETKM
jgi:hypothetical protein